MTLSSRARRIFSPQSTGTLRHPRWHIHRKESGNLSPTRENYRTPPSAKMCLSVRKCTIIIAMRPRRCDLPSALYICEGIWKLRKFPAVLIFFRLSRLRTFLKEFELRNIGNFFSQLKMKDDLVQHLCWEKVERKKLRFNEHPAVNSEALLFVNLKVGYYLDSTYRIAWGKWFFRSIKNIHPAINQLEPKPESIDWKFSTLDIYLIVSRQEARSFQAIVNDGLITSKRIYWLWVNSARSLMKFIIYYIG